jgi:ketosteroid isomerase-like protein
METPEEIFAFADRFIAALNAGDPALVREFYAPGATVWHNFDDADQTLDDNLKLLEWMVRKAPQRSYRVVRREIVPGGWIQQHVLEAQLSNGREMRLHACCVITLENGRIRRIEEYVDPAQAAVLREVRSA